MASRLAAVVQLQEEINDLKQSQRAGFVKDYQGTRLVRMEDSELFKPSKDGDKNKSDAARKAERAQSNQLSDAQKLALVRIKERDREIVSTLASAPPPHS